MTFKTLLKQILPSSFLSYYHYALARLGAYLYGNPSRKLFLIGITGTKGKSTVVELLRAMLAEAGFTTASASTIGFYDGVEWEPNLFKMTMPGRFFLAKLLKRAVERGATHAVVEMTSEGARQFRHSGLEMNALIFTNLQPEHLESHGSMEAYAQAKLSLVRHLANSPKRPRLIVANAEDPLGSEFLSANVEVRVPFSLADGHPYQADEKGCRFTWRGQLMTSPLPGLFNLRNVLAALALGEAMNLPREAMKKALEKTTRIAGRAERVERGQNFTVIVDYAHTPDSLRALYETYKKTNSPLGGPRDDSAAKSRRIICVLGNTGGGRDAWKRPEMGTVADELCDRVFLTNEDPYDEDPQAILTDMEKGFSKQKPTIELDRRRAIRSALKTAAPGDAVLITGKGTDPYIMGKRGLKTPWSDQGVAEEELDKLLARRKNKGYSPRAEPRA